MGAYYLKTLVYTNDGCIYPTCSIKFEGSKGYFTKVGHLAVLGFDEKNMIDIVILNEDGSEKSIFMTELVEE